MELMEVALAVKAGTVVPVEQDSRQQVLAFRGKETMAVPVEEPRVRAVAALGRLGGTVRLLQRERLAVLA